jgi:hypothetical protein
VRRGRAGDPDAAVIVGRGGAGPPGARADRSGRRHVCRPPLRRFGGEAQAEEAVVSEDAVMSGETLSVPQQGMPKSLLQQMEELMAALNADLSQFDSDLKASSGEVSLPGAGEN